MTWTRDTNRLITAYNQEQAYRLFIDGDGTGLQHFSGNLAEIKHDEHGSHLAVQTPNGSIIRVGKSNSVGAITGISLGSLVFCEINLLNMGIIQECFRRTFAAQDRYHLDDLNPPAPYHPVISGVFDVQNTCWTIQGNPIITEEHKQEIYDIFRRILIYWSEIGSVNGLCRRVLSYLMFNMQKNIEHAVLEESYEMFFTADGGQSDATSCSCNIVTRFEGRFRLLRVANYYHSGRDTLA